MRTRDALKATFSVGGSGARKGRAPRARRVNPVRGGQGRRTRPTSILGGVHRFKVLKPYCAPCRSSVYEALQTYGVPILNYEEQVARTKVSDYANKMKLELKTFENLKYGPAVVMFLPLHCEATFSVPVQQANFAEYLIESTDNLMVAQGYRVDKRNRKWGNRRNDMPTPWDKEAATEYAQGKGHTKAFAEQIEQGKAVVESGCSKGNDIWSQVQKIKKEAEKNKKGGR